jgi:hypothetical protein
VDARTEEKALKLCYRLLAQMRKDAPEKKVDPYPKTGGFVVSFATNLEQGRWSDAVVEAIALGQRVGYGWILSGSIEDDPSGWSNDAKVSGIVSIQWQLMRDEDSGAG